MWWWWWWLHGVLQRVPSPSVLVPGLDAPAVFSTETRFCCCAWLVSVSHRFRMRRGCFTKSAFDRSSPRGDGSGSQELFGGRRRDRESRGGGGGSRGGSASVGSGTIECRFCSEERGKEDTMYSVFQLWWILL